MRDFSFQFYSKDFPKTVTAHFSILTIAKLEGK